MLNIFCFYCGELCFEEEFYVKGQVYILCLFDLNVCSDEEWGDYMFFCDNLCGFYYELWVYVVGCCKYFNVICYMVIYEIFEIYLIGEQFSVVVDGEKKFVV